MYRAWSVDLPGSYARWSRLSGFISRECRERKDRERSNNEGSVYIGSLPSSKALARRPDDPASSPTSAKDLPKPLQMLKRMIMLYLGIATIAARLIFGWFSLFLSCQLLYPVVILFILKLIEMNLTLVSINQSMF